MLANGFYILRLVVVFSLSARGGGAEKGLKHATYDTLSDFVFFVGGFFGMKAKWKGAKMMYIGETEDTNTLFERRKVSCTSSLFFVTADDGGLLNFFASAKP